MDESIPNKELIYIVIQRLNARFGTFEMEMVLNTLKYKN